MDNNRPWHELVESWSRPSGQLCEVFCPGCGKSRPEWVDDKIERCQVCGLPRVVLFVMKGDPK
jgi:hypothetical protein